MKNIPNKPNKLLHLVILLLLGMVLVTGCTREEPMKEITQVTYTVESGPILPELQLLESYTITREEVTFTRNGRVEPTSVNQGTWQIGIEAQVVATIFDALAEVDLGLIQKVEPEDIPEGGGSEYFILTYSNGDTFSMEYTPGVTYHNGGLITQPVKEFLKQLELPAEAVPQILVE